MKYLFPLLFLSTFLLSSTNYIDVKHSGHDILSTKQEALIEKTYAPTKSSDNTELKDLMTGLIFECEIDKQKFSLPYRIYIPENYNPNNKYPLVTFFHGLGEVGNDNVKQLGTSFIFLPKLLNKENLAKYPCIVVAPQCTIEDTWVDTDGIGRIVTSSQTTEARSLRAYRLLEKRIKEEYSIDNDRIYITGVSMGGGEYNMDIIATYPSVIYHVFLKSGEKINVDNPVFLPDPSTIEHIEEPMIKCRIMTPSTYIGDVMNLVMSKRGLCSDTQSIDADHVIITADMPMHEILIDFHDKLKSITRGYASTKWK